MNLSQYNTETSVSLEDQSSTKMEGSKSNENHVTFQRAYKVIYFGYAVLDRRYTLPMLPWILAEIKRHGLQNLEEIFIEITDHMLKATHCANNNIIFEHSLKTISKFAQSTQDLNCFTYITRESSGGPCAYHVFRASDENMVLELFSTLKEMSKEMINCSQSTLTPSAVAMDSVSSSCQQYEVLYLGRLKVSGKRSHPTFIDDAVEKFKLFGFEKDRYCTELRGRQRHGSGASVASLPYSLENSEKSCENDLQKFSKEELSSSSGVSSSESINFKSLEAVDQVSCDLEQVLYTPPSSPQESYNSSQFPAQSFVTHSQSMDIALASKALNEDNEFKNNVLPPSSLITHTQSLDSSACSDIVCDLKDLDSDCVRSRVRSCSGDIAPVPPSLPIFHHKKNDNLFQDMRRPRAFTSPSIDKRFQRNRTMLFIIGDTEICLIGMDKKQLVLSKTFNDISCCSQGIKNLDHFGFVCRETSLGGADRYSAYIFRCISEKVVDEMMLTLKMAFSKAHQSFQKLPENITSLKPYSCKSCPMFWFHNICSEIEGLAPEDAHLIILRRFGCLPDSDKENIIVKFQSNNSTNTQEQNETFMMLLREYSEQKQLNHTHFDSSSRNSKSPKNIKPYTTKLDSFRQKAKKSLSYSFDTILKLANRDEPNDSSLRKETSSYKVRKRSFDEKHGSSSHEVPLSRPRSSTINSMHTLREVSQCINSSTSSQEKRFHIARSKIDDHSRSTRSWRHEIFRRLHQVPIGSHDTNHVMDDVASEGKSRSCAKSKDEIRSLWRKAIEQQIILIKINKENAKLNGFLAKEDFYDKEKVQGANNPGNTKRFTAEENVSRDLEELFKRVQYLDEINEVSGDDALLNALITGVPEADRGILWQFIVQRKKKQLLKTNSDSKSRLHISDQTIKTLLKSLTPHHNDIVADIGRTFPQNPFYAEKLGHGQLSLYNLLKAYSLFDPKVGYCQGLSFVAGVLLLYLPDDDSAFEVLKFIMFDLGFRDQYKMSMFAFHIRMYQLDRLIYDYHRDLYNFFVKLDITPTLYAASWFLTFFASQFHEDFTSRLFGFILLLGSEALLKMSLVILEKFKAYIIQCSGFETTLLFIKNELPVLCLSMMEDIFKEAFCRNSDEVNSKLFSYEVEFTVLQEESFTSAASVNNIQYPLILQNESLRLKNLELQNHLMVDVNFRKENLESFESAHATIDRLLNEKKLLEKEINRLKKTVETLEDAGFRALNKFSKEVREDLEKKASTLTLSDNKINKEESNEFSTSLEYKLIEGEISRCASSSKPSSNSSVLT